MGPFPRSFATALSAPIALFIAVATGCLLLAAKAGLFGLPLGLLAVYAIGSYALVLIEHLAHGRQVPVLSIEMVNPAHHARPIGALVLAATGAWAATAATQAFGGPAGAAVGLLVLAVLPAMVALLCLDDSWYSAVSPAHVARLVRGLGLRYGAYLAVACGYTAAGAWVATHAPAPVALAFGLSLVLSLATGLGGLLHARRREAGLEAWVTPEREDASAIQRDEREREQVVHEMYGFVRGANADAAWNCANAWLTRRGSTPEDLAWLRDRTAKWDDRRVADRLTRELVLAHLRRADEAGAVAVLAEWISAGGEFHPGTARELARIIGLSRLAGQAGLANRLLDTCAPRYATDPEITGLLARRARERGGPAP